jgi:hypothetical protein
LALIVQVVGLKDDGIDACFVGLEKLLDEAAHNVYGCVLIPPAKVCESERSIAALECLPEVIDDIGPVKKQSKVHYLLLSRRRSRTHDNIVFPVPA